MNRTIVICTDTWEPQVNGVVRTLRHTIDVLRGWGYQVEVIHPYLFHTFRVPFVRDLEFTTGLNRWRINALLKQHLPCAIHVATEGPLGLACSRFCKMYEVPFTTWHHTDFPMTLPRLFGMPSSICYGYLRWFHRHSSTLMVNTPRMQAKLTENGITTPMRVWPGGVNTHFFRPRAKEARGRKIALYVGRIAKEKGLEGFLDCRGDYEKHLVGDGAARPDLERRYPDARFRGVLHGEELARAFANADVFVFPSKTDTFGLVLIEALACGVPVAAYPVQGPIDILDRPGVGCLDDNLEYAIDQAIKSYDPAICRELALEYSWENSARRFYNNLVFDGAPQSGHDLLPTPEPVTRRKYKTAG